MLGIFLRGKDSVSSFVPQVGGELDEKVVLESAHGGRSFFPS